MKKYELVLNDTKRINGITLYRIRYLIPLSKIKPGDLGGYIQCENNLSQDGNAQVLENAMVYDNAKVFGDAKISGNVRICGNVKVYGNVRMCGVAVLYGNEHIVSQRDLINISCKYPITVTHKNVYVGCKLFTRNEVIKNGKNIAKEFGLSNFEIDCYYKLIMAAIKYTKRSNHNK